MNKLNLSRSALGCKIFAIAQLFMCLYARRMKTPKTVAITKRALTQRLNRALLAQDLYLRYNRRRASYMVIDCVGNFIVEHVDLHQKSRNWAFCSRGKSIRTVSSV